jgi:tRNA (mo5U34)-methyltransferase
VVGSRLRWFSSRKAHGSKLKQPSAYEVVTQLIKEGERAQAEQDSTVAVVRYSEALGRYVEEFRAGRGWMSARQVAEVAVRLGHSRHEEGDTGGAENAFRQAIWVDDGFAAAHASLAYLLHVKEGEQAQKARDWAAAAACYADVLARYADGSADGGRLISSRQLAQIAVRLGHSLREQGDIAGAENAFRKAIALHDRFDQGHYFLGLLLQRGRRQPEAAAIFFYGLQITGSPLLHRGLEDLDYSAAEIDDAVIRGKMPESRSVPDDPDFPPRPFEGIGEKVNSYPWFHSINLGDGIVTPGHKTRIEISREADAIFAPISVRSRSVIDIGAWNGGFTLEAKRRGAARILAIDEYAWDNPELRGKETFDLVMTRLGVDVETRLIDIQNASPKAIGRWQVVLFLGVFYHLFDPIAALKCLADITDEVLVLETHLELQDVVKPAMAFYPGGELSGDATNWWAPNRAAVEALLKIVGFPKVLYTPHPTSGEVRGVFHAFKSEAIWHEHSLAARGAPLTSGTPGLGPPTIPAQEPA